METRDLLVLAAVAVSLPCLHACTYADPQPLSRPSAVRRDQLNLMDVSHAISDYACAHGGQLPASLGGTLPYIQQWTAWTPTLHPKLSPKEQAALFLSAQDLARTSIPDVPTADWIDAHTSYVYLGHGGQKFDKVDPNKTVIVYLKPEQHHDVTTPNGSKVAVYPVAMLDGHAEAESKEQTDPEIARSTEALRQHG